MTLRWKKWTSSPPPAQTSLRTFLRGGDRPPVAQQEGSISEQPAKKSVTFDLGTPLASPTMRKTPKTSALKKKAASHNASSLLA